MELIKRKRCLFVPNKYDKECSRGIGLWEGRALQEIRMLNYIINDCKSCIFFNSWIDDKLLKS